MESDEKLRQRIIHAASELFAEQGYGGTRVHQVAERAGTSSRTVKRLTGGRAELFAEVMASRVQSDAADIMAAAAENPDATPPLSVLLEAAAEIFAAPERSWNILELEALTRSHRDEEIRALERSRLQKRSSNMKAVTDHTRRVGGIDSDVDDDAFVHFALALSVGLALVDPVVAKRPGQAQWNGLMARIGRAIAPEILEFTDEHEARRPWRLRIDVPDRPGGMAALVRALSSLHVNVVMTYLLSSKDGRRTIDVAVTTPESITGEMLLAAAMSAGSKGYVTEGSPDDAQDLVTRIIDGAIELVTNPGFAPLAASLLVEADSYEVTKATQGEDDSLDVLRLQWTMDRHVVLHRDWAPFAREEKTRASALLRLASAISRAEGSPEAMGWVDSIKGGGTVWIRLSRPEDADAVAAMHERSSEQSRYRRYLALTEWREVNLRRLSGGHRGATLVAMSEEGDIVGLGNVFPNEPGDETAAEIAVIVEDAYQGRGVGTRLVRHMLDVAERLGFQEIVATVLAENTGMLHVLEATGLDWSNVIEGGVLTMRAPLPTAVSDEMSAAEAMADDAESHEMDADSEPEAD